MTKTLRIASIVLAAIIVAAIALPPLFSSGTEETARQILEAPSILESFRQAKGKPVDIANSPLVKQAQAFALYLDPPPAPAPRRTTARTATRTTTVRPAAPVSSKFDLLGTSYFASNPKMSMALIDEPGKGIKWVRQGSEIGRIVVKEITNGKVVMDDNGRTYELEPIRVAKRSLLKGGNDNLPTPVSTNTIDAATPSPPTRIPTRTTTRARTSRTRRTAPAPAPVQQPDVSEEEAAKLKAFMDGLQGIEDQALLEEKANELFKMLDESIKVSDEEAKLLEELGKELKDPNAGD